MYNKFSVPEINLMCIYGAGDKTALLAELRNSLPYIYEPDMRDVYSSTIEKLENISDKDFSDIGFYMADEFMDEVED